MTTTLAPRDAAGLPLYLVEHERLGAFLDARAPAEATWLRATAFLGAIGDLRLLPDPAGGVAGAAMGWGSAETRSRGRFHLARAVAHLPPGDWRLDTAAADLDADDLAEAALAWLLAGYRFDRYRAAAAHAGGHALALPAGVDPDLAHRMAAAESLTRDLINTPANDMGPDALEQAARDVARAGGASVAVTEGSALLAGNLPLIHAVGRAGATPPRLIDLRWGTKGPLLTLVGKGVCFDTGGLDLKPATGMGLMKKDMGGAATVLGLAQAIMSARMQLRLRVLIPAVENAVAGNAFRPQDILRSRLGPTVEINNTDAEGRLVLADALALGAEDAPDLMVSMATLTGAARVALGPDVPPYFTDDAALSAALDAAAARVRDPLWRMPFWPAYEPLIEPGIADLDNAPGGGMAGAITAALFLRRFAGGGRYVHFDIYGWQPVAAPGRPKGGVGQGARALFAALPGVLGL